MRDMESYLFPVGCLLSGTTFQEWCITNFSIRHKIFRIYFWNSGINYPESDLSLMDGLWWQVRALWEGDLLCFGYGNGLDDFPKSLSACSVLSKRCRNKIICKSQPLCSHNRLDLPQKQLHREVCLHVRPSIWERPNGLWARVNVAKW